MKQFPNYQDGDVDIIVNRVLSRSAVAKSPKEIQDQVKEEIISLLTTHPETAGKTTYRVTYITDVYTTKSLPKKT